MLNCEVREWIQKVKRGQYSYEDAMYEFRNFIIFLTREEIRQLSDILKSSYKT